MSIIKWSDELGIGIDYIDEQHKQLINTINELHLAVQYGQSNDVILPIIDRLLEYASSHFRTEEELLVKHGYPDLVDHTQEHLEFIGKIEDLNQQFRNNKEVLAIHVRDFLLAWFFTHIRTNDMEYKEFLDKRKALAHHVSEAGNRNRTPK